MVTAPVVEHGLWSVALSLGEVGHLRHDGREVLRAVRVVARDRDWNTLPHTAGDPTVSREGEAVIIALPITITTDPELDEDGSAAATAEVEVRLDDACTVSATITAERELLVGRLGIVVLHPPALAGSTLVIGHPDGTTTATVFPVHIAPHQPARDIATLAYPVPSGTVTVTVAFSGDVFETEDQRNCTDASYKTYSRPLSLPFPYRVAAGEAVTQSVRVTVTSELQAGLPSLAIDSVPRAVGPADAAEVFTVGTSSGRHVDSPLPPPAPGAGPLLVELTADRSSWKEIAGRAALEADALGVPVDLRIVAADADGLAAALTVARGLELARIGVFDPVTHVTEAPGWDAPRHWRDAERGPAPLAAGTRAHFTELNRTVERLPRDADLVAFSITPMMHATDPEHVEESLAMQPLVARDAVALASGIPVVVGPVTFRRRFNAVATSPSPGSVVEARRATDPVVASEYAASWFARSVEALRVPGVIAGTWFEATGPRGLVGADGALTPAGRAWYRALPSSA